MKENNKNKKFLFGLGRKKYIYIILLIVVIPIALNWIVFSNDIKSNVSNDAWAAFFGSYIGGLFTLFGVGVTLYVSVNESNEDRKNTQTQIIEQKRLEFLPHLSLLNNECNKADYRIFFENKEAQNNYKSVEGSIELMNIGNGPAINLTAACVKIKGKSICNIKKDSTTSIAPGHWIFLSYNVFSTEEIKSDMTEKIEITIRYKDIFENKYQQIICGVLKTENGGYYSINVEDAYISERTYFKD